MVHPGTIRRTLNAFVVGRFETLHRGLLVAPEHDLIVGQGATILGNVLGGRIVHLGKAVTVRGTVEADADIVVGSRCHVDGDVIAGGNVLVLEGAMIQGRILARGRARIIGARVGRGVEALGDVEVRGRSELEGIRAGGRIRTLAAPIPESSIRDSGPFLSKSGTASTQDSPKPLFKRT